MREYAIKLDKKRNLYYGMRQLKKIEDITGKKIVKFDINEVTLDDLITIFYVGLTNEDPELKLEQMDELIDKHYNLGKLYESVNNALVHVFGISGDEEGKN